MNDADIATHEDPAWMAQANFIIVADLGGHGMQGRLEQLWARQPGEAEFVICCIPFFTYSVRIAACRLSQGNGAYAGSQRHQMRQMSITSFRKHGAEEVIH
jgi:hypothetical protein